MRLGKRHRALVLTALIAVGLSGMVWFVLHDLVGSEPDELLHEVLVAHGVASFATLLAFGSVLPLHSLAGWRQRRNLLSGAGVVCALAILAISALLLYYAGEEWRPWARLVHIVVGGMAVILVPLHIVLGRRRAAPPADRAEVGQVTS